MYGAFCLIKVEWFRYRLSEEDLHRITGISACRGRTGLLVNPIASEASHRNLLGSKFTS
jgi:hypothetical protein